MCTLKKIAADLGVSCVLVSRVLSNRMGTTRVGANTRAAILRRAREVDYTPNQFAAALKAGRKGAIGILIHKVGIPGSELSLEFLRAATRSDANLRIRFFTLDAEFHAACEHGLRHHVDALIIAGLAHDTLLPFLKVLEQHGLHVVCTCEGVKPQGNGLVGIYLDRQHQSYLTTQHLIARGCRRIAHFDTFDERTKGFIQAHRDASLPWFDHLIIKTDSFTRDAGYASTHALLQTREPFDAINAQSDGQACGAMHYLSHAGIARRAWPRITGIDDSPIARSYCDIPLTSATNEMGRCAELAIEAVLAKLSGVAIGSTIVRPQLVVRESTL